jgi:Xaa-Pro aminopeptidase
MSVTKKEMARRRRQLMGLMEANSIAILPAARAKARSRDTDYHFRQDSDFFYLSGFAEPDAVLVLLPGREHGEYVLFCREKDPIKEAWDGYRAGPEDACDKFGADDAFPIDDIDDILPGLLEGRERVYYSLGKDAEFDRHLMEWVNILRGQTEAGAHPPGEFLDLDHHLHDMRLFKSAAEQKVMQTAGEITSRAHRRAMLSCQPGRMEYQLEAEILHEFAMSGARHAAYTTIVGGGKNALVFHYIDNDSTLRNGDLVLIDAGCEYQGYASDVTRTFPVNGRFSPSQKAIYELVLAIQNAALSVIEPGRHWDDPHEISVQVATVGLVELGLLEGNVDELIQSEAYKRYYMHRIGHWIGLDVHDVGDYKVGDEWRVLEPGMAMTVEPGLYIPVDDERVAKKWRGIAVRIEDDVVVTKTGYHMLTTAPKTVAEIESLMQEDTVLETALSL